MKLKCLGAYPKRKLEVIIEEWGYLKLQPGQITHELSEFEANLMLKKYPTIFEKVFEEPQENKMLKKQKVK